DGGNRHKALRVTATGTVSNRDAIGTRVRVTLENGTKLWSTVKTGSSYCSQSELPLTFVLGNASKVTAIEVTWPNGRVETLPSATATQSSATTEGKGIVRSTTIRSRCPPGVRLLSSCRPYSFSSAWRRDHPANHSRLRIPLRRKRVKTHTGPTTLASPS